MKGRRLLLKELLALQQETGLRLPTDDELLLIQQHWKGTRDPDDSCGVARLVNEHRSLPMNDLRETARMPLLEAEVAEEKNLNALTFQRLVAKFEEDGEMQRAHYFKIERMRILQEDRREKAA